MKKLFTLFLALVASVGAIYAQSGSCGDNLTWTYSPGTLTISGTGAMADYISSPMPWYNYREVIKSVIIAEGVTSIGSGAFSDCSSLTSVTIPNSVTSIGDNAFSDCSSLSSITIPNSVISIGIWGFGGCSSLTSVTIGSGVMSIGIQAFSYCSSLTSVDVANDNPNYCSIDGVLFSKDKTTLIQYPIGNHRTKYTINNSVTNIGREAFLGCSLTSITIPNSVMSIGASAFFECTALTSVTFEGSTPPSIDRDVFYNTNNCPIYVPSGRKEVYVAALNVNNTIDESRVIEKTVIPQNLGQKTIAEFLALKNPIDTCILTGVVANIVMDSNDPTQYNEYGNFDIVDETGTLYVYGLLTLEGQTKQFRTMGVDAGDTLTVMATYNEYNSKPQAKNAIFVSLKEGNGSAPVETADVVFTAVDFAGQGVTGTGGPVSATKDSVIFTCNKGYGSKYDVRCYKGSTVTIASTTEQIAKIEFDFDTISGTSYDGGLDPVTVVNAKEWTVTLLSSQTRMNKISIYFGTAEAVKIDTITVAEALVVGEALADNSYSDKKYAVVGYVAKAKAFGEKYPDAQTFYMSNDATATYGDFTAYNCKVAAPGVVPGDYVAVVGKIQKYVGISGTPTIEITGGEVVKIQYTIKGIANIEEAGTVIIDSTPKVFCHKITAVPNYGYHFVQWSDGNTENPRSFILTQDTIFTAEFAPNIYSFNVTWDEDLGNVQATDGSFEYLTPLTISATPNYGYHFVRWSDGNTDNPRTYVLKDNVTLKTIFAPNVYSISALNNPEGTVNGTGSFNYLTECSIEAVPNYGYHFVKWNDGITDNPRTVILTQDTIFAPIYSLSKKGKCGDELALTWEYDALTKTLTISGSGTLNSNYTFGIEAPTNVERLIISEGVTAIGGGAFANYVSIKHISVAASVKTIYEQAFYNCIGLQEIYSYRATPATAYSTTFDGIEKFDCVLHVLASSIDMYKFATGWRDFYYVEAIGVDNTTDIQPDITITPSDNEANVTWPTVSGAASYELVIKDKNGNIVCTLIFNANGQLTSIAFNAPSRNGAPAQTQSAGFSFTITGLDSGTGYDLTLTAKDNSGNAIQTETISFVTTGGNVSTDIDQLQGNEVQSTKVIKDGQVLILRNGKTYTMQGQEVK